MQLVAAGYDAMADTWEGWSARVTDGPRHDWLEEFRREPMFFSGHPPETNSRLLRDAGFDLVRNEPVTITEPEGAVSFHWVLGRR